MRVVGRQGTSLTESQRRRLELQRQAKPQFLGDHLLKMLDDSAREIARMEEQGIRGENPNKFSHDYTVKGTPFVGDVSGY